jgi:long-chain fatty acid transport protein
MKFNQTLLAVSIGATLAFSSFNAQAGGFALAEQSIATMGNANAGASAMTMNDASTVFYNPAGLSRITQPQVAQGLHVISLKADFVNGSSQGAFGQTASTSEPGSIGTPTPVPAFFAAMPLTSNIGIGIGVSAPFGLKTEYNEGWIGRYQALISEVKSINVNPSISFKVNDQLSLGAGFNFMRFQAKLTNNVNYTAVAIGGLRAQNVPAAQIAALTPALVGREGAVKIQGSDTNYGFNVGALWSINPDTRVGLAYRSSIKFDLAGDVQFTRPATDKLPASIAGTIGLIQNAGTPDGAVTVAIKTPATTSIAAVTKISPSTEVMAEISRTEWSSVPGLNIKRTTGTTLTSVVYDWKDTTRLSAGVSHAYSSGITARMGIAYDPSVMRDDRRTARLPDNNRVWLSAGGSYQVKPNIRLDAAFTHIFVQRAKISEGAGSINGYLHGAYEGSVNILSLGAVVTF